MRKLKHIKLFENFQVNEGLLDIFRSKEEKDFLRGDKDPKNWKQAAPTDEEIKKSEKVKETTYSVISERIKIYDRKFSSLTKISGIISQYKIENKMDIIFIADEKYYIGKYNMSPCIEDITEINKKEFKNHLTEILKDITVYGENIDKQVVKSIENLLKIIEK